MSPRAKPPAAKSKAEKATASKFVRTITTTASTSRDTDVDGVRTPGDWAGKFDLRNANNPWDKRRNYGDQTEQDHDRLVKAIKVGKVPAIEG